MTLRGGSLERAEGGQMKGIKELALMMASTGMIAVLLGVYFDWRARLLGRIRDHHHAHG